MIYQLENGKDIEDMKNMLRWKCINGQIEQHII